MGDTVFFNIVQSLQAVSCGQAGLRVQTEWRVYRLVLLQRGRRSVRHAQLGESADRYGRRVSVGREAHHAGTLA